MKNKEQKEENAVNKGINFAINELEIKIANDINYSQLPLSVVRLILGNILEKIKNAEKVEVQKESQAFLNSVQKSKNKKDFVKEE